MPQFSDHVNDVLESSVDWLTCTAKPGTKALLLLAAADRWMKTRADEGYRMKPWVWNGYVGDTVDGLSLGQRQDGTIVRLSGEVAAKHAATALGLSDNVSRVDVQCTLLEKRELVDWSAEVIRIASKDPRVIAGMTKTCRFVSTPSGRTCYIGSRISERYYRCYDKHAESEGTYPAGSWRWEVEYKNGRALSVATFLKRDECRPDCVRRVVEQAFGDYGVTLPCRSLLNGWRDAGIRHITTDERRIHWLEKSVGPAIEKLLESVDRDTILRALHLDDAGDQP